MCNLTFVVHCEDEFGSKGHDVLFFVACVVHKLWFSCGCNVLHLACFVLCLVFGVRWLVLFVGGGWSW